MFSGIFDGIYGLNNKKILTNELDIKGVLEK